MCNLQPFSGCSDVSYDLLKLHRAIGGVFYFSRSSLPSACSRWSPLPTIRPDRSRVQSSVAPYLATILDPLPRYMHVAEELQPRKFARHGPQCVAYASMPD